MRTDSAFEMIRRRQIEWAKKAKLAGELTLKDDEHTESVNENLFLPLCPDVRQAFAEGKGGELDGGKPKMSAVYSSSALAVNMFLFWHQKGSVDEIAQACGLRPGAKCMRFEATYPTPLRGTPPHLDLEFWWDDGWRAGVECKFAEPYRSKTRSTEGERNLSKYLKSEKLSSFWKEAPGCHSLATEISRAPRDKPTFKHLDAAQLIKHAIGMRTQFGKSNFDLLYLWYATNSLETKAHRNEIEVFSKRVTNEIRFSQMTYQNLFAAVGQLKYLDRSYTDYLTDRYF